MSIRASNCTRRFGAARRCSIRVLDIAGIVPDHDLDVMQLDQTLDALTANLLVGLGKVMDAVRPGRVIVGDTATAMRRSPITGGAGRSCRGGPAPYNIYHPRPEEVNRKIIGDGQRLHFCPDRPPPPARSGRGRRSCARPCHRQYRDRRRTLGDGASPPIPRWQAGWAIWRRVSRQADHRRDQPPASAKAWKASPRPSAPRIARRPDVAVIFPVHLNPAIVRKVMNAALAGLDNVALDRAARLRISPAC